MKRLLALILLLPLSMAYGGNDLIGQQPRWNARQPLALAELPAGMPANAAGCVVVGFHVLADGSTAKARMMKGAFAGGVTTKQQRAFAIQALGSVSRWRFDPVVADWKPALFRLATIGFGPGKEAKNRVVTGLDGLPEPLQAACQIKDLAAWGDANAMAVDKARSEHGGKIALPDPSTGEAFWVFKKAIAMPKFPTEAIRDGVEACILLGLVVDESGKATDVMLLDSKVKADTGPNSRHRRELEELAMTAASYARFAPGPDNLERWAAVVQVPLQFSTSGIARARTRVEAMQKLQELASPATGSIECRKLGKQELQAKLDD